MGDFANWLNAGASVIGAASSAIGAGRRIRKQKEAQMELNEQAAKLNYDYGEKAAQNAFERQLQMYERSYQDQSFAAMRKQAEDAGLSVGMLYGNGGAGGQGGATSGAPQGETGGAQAGDAASMYANEMQRQLSLKQLALQNASLIKDLKIKDKEADNLDAEAKEKRARTKTENDSRELKIANLKEEGRFKWIQNIRAEWESEHDGSTIEEAGGEVYGHELFGQFGVINNSIWAGEKSQNLYKLLTEIAQIEENTELTKTLKKLNDEKAKYYFSQIMSEIGKNNAEAAESAARRLAALHSIGEVVNWKTYVDYGVQAVQMLMNAVAGIQTAKAVKKGLSSQMKEITSEEIVTQKGDGQVFTTKKRETTKGRW